MTAVPLPAEDRTLHDTARGSSFHMAILLLPKGRRKALLTLYALCRALDDAVDDAPDAASAQTALAQWETELQRVFSGITPTLPLAQDFLQLHRRYGFQPQDMQAMLTALRMDAEGHMLRPSAAELETYCYGVACTVGLMSMRIFGCDGDHVRPFAVALGHALQLTNILRDVYTDAAMGRIYLPREWLADVVAPADIATSPAVRPACIRLARQAEAYFRESDTHAQRLPSRAIAPALAMRDVYASYWRKLHEMDWHAPPDGKIPLSAIEKAILARRASSYMLGKFKPVEL